MKSIECFLMEICNDRVDELLLLKKIFAAYEPTQEMSLIVSAACNASIHATNWAPVVRHAYTNTKWKFIVDSANILLTEEKKQVYAVDVLLERVAEFTTWVFRVGFEHETLVDKIKELLPQINGRAKELHTMGLNNKALLYNKASKVYAQVQKDIQVCSENPSERERLRANAGNAFLLTLEAYKSRCHFAHKGRIDAFVNAMRDCDIRLEETVKAGISGGWWQPQLQKGVDKQSKQLDSRILDLERK
jgi:hypothetical protein